MVLADGFYEWQQQQNGGKQPYFIYFPQTKDAMVQSPLLCLNTCTQLWAPAPTSCLGKSPLPSYCSRLWESVSQQGCVLPGLSTLAVPVTAVSRLYEVTQRPCRHGHCSPCARYLHGWAVWLTGDWAGSFTTSFIWLNQWLGYSEGEGSTGLPVGR